MSCCLQRMQRLLYVFQEMEWALMDDVDAEDLDPETLKCFFSGT